MDLKDIKYEDFLKYIAQFETEPKKRKKMLLEAIKNVPLIAHLMKIQINAIKKKAPDKMIQTGDAVISTLVALYQIDIKKTTIKKISKPTTKPRQKQKK